MDSYFANTIYLNKAESAMWATNAVPRLASLRFVLREALLSYLPGRIEHIEEHVHTAVQQFEEMGTTRLQLECAQEILPVQSM